MRGEVGGVDAGERGAPSKADTRGMWPSYWNSLSFFSYDKLHMSYNDHSPFEKIGTFQVEPPVTSSPTPSFLSPEETALNICFLLILQIYKDTLKEVILFSGFSPHS